MKVALAIPFGSEERTRISAHERAYPVQTAAYPFFKVRVYDSGHRPFNRAATRNMAVHDNEDADVIVLCDADSIPDAGALQQAVSAAAEDGFVHFPFNRVRSYTRPDRRTTTFYEYGPSAGGCYVFRPQTWWDCGGMDERLGGWGTDDRSFLVQINTFSNVITHPGILTCLWHRRGDCQPDPEQLKILDEYFPLEYNSEGLREYLAKRGT